MRTIKQHLDQGCYFTVPKDKGKASFITDSALLEADTEKCQFGQSSLAVFCQVALCFTNTQLPDIV